MSVLIVFLVDRIFCRVWSKCPFIIAADHGGCFLRVLAVKPGMFVMYPFWSAFSNVLNEGEKKAACMNCTMSAVVFLPIAAFA